MVNKNEYDFGGWATKANLKCSDGLVIMNDAFKDNDGKKVPLVWNHDHNDPNNVLGHAALENRGDGVYAYCWFNDTDSGKVAKQLIMHGDIDALSIWANRLKKHGSCVMHGDIKEVSLVLAGANPGALIDMVMAHGEDTEDEAIIYTGELLELFHSDGGEDREEIIEHSDKPKKSKSEENKEDNGMAETEKKPEKPEDEETVQDVVNSMTEKQKTVMYALIGQALDDKGGNNEGEEEDKTVKHNLFENEAEQGTYLSHTDEENIINLAKTSSVGSLQDAINIYAENNGGTLAHSIDNIEELFPEYTDVHPGAPELLTNDQSWVDGVMNRVEKSPISRIRTRQTDARLDAIRASGYIKGKKKKDIGNIKLMNRTTDPQTVYVKDKLERDDVVDITDFDVVEYQYRIMRMALNEDLATAILIGDGREEGDEQKISEDHIRSIWHDDELYTIHKDVNVAAAKKELQGSNTSASFGENYIYAEAIISAALYAREHYKGSGALDFYCTPRLLNVMLLARDLNGRRIYDSKTDLAAALNVGNIYTVEQFEGKTRKTNDNQVKKLLGLFVNLKDYRVGSVKNGQITKFEDFDIDFNQYKYLMETRLSGALTKVYSAIALEEPVIAGGSIDTGDNADDAVA